MRDLDKIGKFLIGNWKGKIGEDIVDEVWSLAMANSIMGMFRWIKDGKVYFYEFVVIDNIDEIIKLKIKHFNSDLLGWEEKNDFVYYILREIKENELIFVSEDPKEEGRLIYRKTDQNTLIAILEMAKSSRTLKFAFNKVD